jgi:hypothetical protein
MPRIASSWVPLDAPALSIGMSRMPELPAVPRSVFGGPEKSFALTCTHCLPDACVPPAPGPAVAPRARPRTTTSGPRPPGPVCTTQSGCAADTPPSPSAFPAGVGRACVSHRRGIGVVMSFCVHGAPRCRDRALCVHCLVWCRGSGSYMGVGPHLGIQWPSFIGAAPACVCTCVCPMR